MGNVSRRKRGSQLTELEYQFCTIAGSYVPEGMPIYLLVSDAQLDDAVRALIRVGLDRIVGYFTPDTLAEYWRLGGALRRTATVDMAEVETRRSSGNTYLLDVRGAAEFESGHLPDALHVPHTRIGVDANSLPGDKPLLVYCNSGARAAAAVAMLTRLGFDATAVNDNFANYRRAQELTA